MKVGVELVATGQIEVQLGSFVEISLSAGDRLVPRAIGQDEYHLSTKIPEGNRFAATGRKYICQLDLPGLGLGPMEARPSVTVPIREEDQDFKTLTITIRTNLIFELQEFWRYVVIRLIINGSTINIDTSICTSPKPGLFEAIVKIT